MSRILLNVVLRQRYLAFATPFALGARVRVVQPKEHVHHA